MTPRNFLAAAVLAALPLSAASAADYPERPVQMIVPWGAGGGTDAVARIMASVMQEDLGVPVNVVNRTGGSGVVGHAAIANAKPDGYTLGLATVEIAMLHWQGLTDLTYQDYDILALVNQDPAGLMVAEDSPFDSAQALLDAVKADPAGTYKASGTAQGGIWHIALAGWMLAEGLEPTQITWVPSQGSASGITDMVAGGVDMVPSSLAEGTAMLDAGRIRALASMSAERQDAFPDVPTLKEAVDSDWTMSVWRGIFAPKGLPEDVKARLTEAVKAAYDSPEYQEFMTGRGLGTIWVPGAEADAFIAASDADFGKVMKAAGLAGDD
ncbi:tripartite tricarboxylate transporter substrate binding protein [Mangrovicoccus algicola]|uniref:Tripartite tricarboxylate transporter substrate binding protein n=1 Tax=Mangrovicoccus algicola TaxID=2771008 RepID=A0A8J7CWZ0_9RHOB|nr:tripartite tricarboxylate transporter substrate binding protein [Mangrovicoccus algicola]MBE3639959.1 tripartite tricarboxylate transporter substrate binding protein [Mangrovicoccus algicola]